MSMPEGFDFSFLPEGDIIMDSNNHDIQTLTDYELKIQLAYNRIKSITHDWFIDNIGANLEELIGKPCTFANVEFGKQRIIQSLTYDNLWSSDDIYIAAKIVDNVHIYYSVYLRVYHMVDSSQIVKGSVGETLLEDPISYEIIAELDLVKGVYIRYGWRPRRTGNFAGINYHAGPRPFIPYRASGGTT